MISAVVPSPRGFKETHHEHLSYQAPLLVRLSIHEVFEGISWRWSFWTGCVKNSSPAGDGNTSSPSPSLGKSDGKAAGKGSAQHSTQKRKRQSDFEGTEDNDESSSTRRAKYNDKTNQNSRLLACPYFKRNPEQFSKSPVCVGPGWPTVYRLKEHLFRRHAPPAFQCRRCFLVFDSNDSLDAHLRATKPCKLREKVELHGQFTSDQQNELRKRTKGVTTQTEREKWIDVYRILFPGEGVPSPYYDYDLLGEPKFIEFFQQEFPPLVKRRLETKLVQLDQALMNSIVEICLDSHSEVQGRWNSSRAAAGSSVGSTSTKRLPESSTALKPPLSANGPSSGSYEVSQSTLPGTSIRKLVSFPEGGHVDAAINFPSSPARKPHSQLPEALDSSYSSEEILGDLETQYSCEGPALEYLGETMSMSEAIAAYTMLSSNSMEQSEEMADNRDA